MKRTAYTTLTVTQKQDFDQLVAAFCSNRVISIEKFMERE